jgi:DNA-binding transcriptional ArsR family regulator
MQATPMLQPTLWRTCRVLANRTRLRIFVLLLEQPGQTVSLVAARLKLSLPVASQYLRAMEARSLLKVRRSGLRVAYRIADGQTSPAQGLVLALRQTFRRDSSPAEIIFKQATAFTHVRRIECFRVLNGRAQTLAELRATTGISARAIVRHISKLEARGFVVCRQSRYTVVDRSDAFGRELARLAAGQQG